MKKFARRLQQFGEQAARVQQAIDAAPAKAAQIRESVMATAGQVQQLRADVLSSVTSLRSTDDARLVQAIGELGEAGDVLAQAGVELEAVELEMGMHQRLVVQLARIAEIPTARIRALRDLQGQKPIVQSVLGALLTAQEFADKVHGGNLEFSRLTAYVGASPSVRIIWEPIGLDDAEMPAPGPAAAASAPPPVPQRGAPSNPDTTPSMASGAAPSSFGAYGSSSFFEPRSASAASTSTPVTGKTVVAKSPDKIDAEEAVKAAARPTGDWRTDALARFKKMPDLSKR